MNDNATAVNDQKYDLLLEKVCEEVTSYLGFGWVYDSTHIRKSFNGGRIINTDGRVIIITSHTWKKRLTVRGILPFGPSGERYNVTPSIGMVIDKAPRLIARSIQKRLLPEYEEAFKHSVENSEKAFKTFREKQSIALELAKLAGVEISERHRDKDVIYSRFGKYGACTIHVQTSDSIKIEIRGADKNKTEQIIEILKENEAGNDE